MFKVFHHTSQFRGTKGGPAILRKAVDGLALQPNESVFTVLRGFDVGYDGGDHHLRQLSIHSRVSAPDTAGRSELWVEAGLRDASGNWDDAYSGKVDVDIVVAPSSAVVLKSSIPIDAPAGTKGPKYVADDVNNSWDMQTGATAVFLSGFQVGYTSGDHHVLRMHVAAHWQLRHVGNQYLRLAHAMLGLRDSSGNWDDGYGGVVESTLVHMISPAEVTQVGPNRSYVIDSKEDPLGTPPTSVGNGPQRPVERVGIPSARRGEPVVGLRAFAAGFGNGDHHFGQLFCRLTRTTIAPDGKLETQWEQGLRDRSGNWDDPYWYAAAAEVLTPTG